MPSILSDRGKKDSERDGDWKPPLVLREKIGPRRDVSDDERRR